MAAGDRVIIATRYDASEKLFSPVMLGNKIRGL